MNLQAVQQRSGRRLIFSKPVFKSTLWIFTVTIIAIWVWGIFVHRTLYANTLISTGILSFISALFFSTALFKGFKLKDNLGSITNRFKWAKWSELPSLDLGGGWFCVEGGEGASVFEIILLILAAIVTAILFFFMLWLFSNLLWAFTLSIAGALYWIFFRAVRLVLKNTKKCRGKLWSSIFYGLGYTILYSCLFYIIILTFHFL